MKFKTIFSVTTLYNVLSYVTFTSAFPERVTTPSSLYIGLYSGQERLQVITRDNYQHNCVKFPKAPNNKGLSEECKYYGDCCKDPMRIREKLESGTFSCQSLPSLGMLRLKSVCACVRVLFNGVIQ